MLKEILSIPEISLTYSHKQALSKRPKITSSTDAEVVFREILDSNLLGIKEEAAVLFLNRANRVIGGYQLSSGGITGTIVDIRLVLGIALKALACSIVLAHTHPSGELNPSRADQALTLKLKEAAIVMDILLVDHLIITSCSYLSFADEGLL